MLRRIGVLVVNNDLRVCALVTAPGTVARRARRFATGRRRTRTTACNQVGSPLGGGDHGPGGGGDGGVGAGEPPAVGLSGEQLQDVEGGVVHGDVVAELAAVELAGGGAPAEPEQQGSDLLLPLLGGGSGRGDGEGQPPGLSVELGASQRQPGHDVAPQGQRLPAAPPPAGGPSVPISACRG